MQEDMESLRRPAHWLPGSRGSLPRRVPRRVVAGALAGYCVHPMLAIAERAWRF